MLIGKVTIKPAIKKIGTQYYVDFNGWTFISGPLRFSEIMCGNTVVAKPLSSKLRIIQPFEFYNTHDELYILMCYFTRYLNYTKDGLPLSDQLEDKIMKMNGIP